MAANRLAQCTSPYLLQHANNPVNWYPWGDEALNKAQDEGKPIIVSIGYSSCHWCHVMEEESFEDPSVAEIMNKHFVSIKVDREERPDVDQIYMDAVQVMGIQGGWPLNVFLTPDQKPFYGGTYFPKQTWVKLLLSVAKTYQEKNEDILKSADEITNYINRQGTEMDGSKGSPLNHELLNNIYNEISKGFDREWGGIKKAPKFPMPSIWRFMLRYSHLSEDKDALDHTLFTLKKIAMGGIFDILKGGFARYSVDEKWKVPHFEKMLYDNAQLLSLYAEAYQVSKDPYFEEVIRKTVAWLKDEMMSPAGTFYSALDADSEGEEGKYYIWSLNEIKGLIKDPEWFIEYYQLSQEGNWEHGRNILFAQRERSEFAKEKNIESGQFEEYLEKCHSRLLKERNKRVRPGLDDKMIASWNAMTVEGLIQAYIALQDQQILDLALNTAEQLRKDFCKGDHLLRISTETNKIPGFLDDYAWVIHSFILMYETTLDHSWLDNAGNLISACLNNFSDPESPLLYYTGKKDHTLVSRKKEFLDNVIPSSNSMMAINLYKFGLLTGNDQFCELSEKMILETSGLMDNYPEYMTQWAIAFTMLIDPTVEIAIAGKQAPRLAAEIQREFIPNRIVAGTTSDSPLPLLKNRTGVDKTTIYICFEGKCNLPVHTVKDALNQIKESKPQ